MNANKRRLTEAELEHIAAGKALGMTEGSRPGSNRKPVAWVLREPEAKSASLKPAMAKPPQRRRVEDW